MARSVKPQLWLRRLPLTEEQEEEKAVEKGDKEEEVQQEESKSMDRNAPPPFQRILRPCLLRSCLLRLREHPCNRGWLLQLCILQRVLQRSVLWTPQLR